MLCPCCGLDFDTFVVKAGKVNSLGIDYDMRPLFDEIDPLKYDAALCPICGYAALLRDFDTTSQSQRNLISEHITPRYTGIEYDSYYYSYEDAVIRYKMALLNDVVSKGKNSRKAYTCLKLSWVLRGWIEREGSGLSISEKKNLEAQEYECIQKAFEGFELANDKESFPICGMDESTFTYLLAVLAYKLEDYKKSIRYTYDILGDIKAPAKLNDMALELKLKIKEIVKNNMD